MLADDEQHGEANRKLMQEWLAEWVPVSLDAGRKLQPIWSQVAEKVVTFDESLSRSKARMTGLLEDLKLEIPKEIRS
jgi:propane monooxygenase small subunit